MALVSAPLTLPRHTCFLVDDLEASMAAFTSSTGTAFDPVREVPMRMVSDGEDVTELVRFAYSTDGTIELVAGTSRGAFGPAVPRGVHHIGHLTDADFDRAVEHQKALGENVEWRVFLGDLLLAAYVAPTAGRPVCLELVNPAILAQGAPS